MRRVVLVLIACSGKAPIASVPAPVRVVEPTAVATVAETCVDPPTAEPPCQLELVPEPVPYEKLTIEQRELSKRLNLDDHRYQVQDGNDAIYLACLVAHRRCDAPISYDEYLVDLWRQTCGGNIAVFDKLKADVTVLLQLRQHEPSWISCDRAASGDERSWRLRSRVWTLESR